MREIALAARLKSDFEGLSLRFQEAARWVIDHPADVALLTTREQARRAGVSPATMTRLAQRFGLQATMRSAKLYADAVRRRPDSFRGRAQELLYRRDAEGDAALVQDIFSSQVQHLQALSSPAASKRFSAAAERIAGADRVFCLGLRSTFSVVYIFHYVRSLFGAASILVDGAGGTGLDVLRTIGRRDVLLVVTVRPYTRQTVKAAQYASSRGAKVVAITDSEISPLASLANETLIIGTETPSFFHSMTPAFAAVECLAALVAPPPPPPPPSIFSPQRGAIFRFLPPSCPPKESPRAVMTHILHRQIDHDYPAAVSGRGILIRDADRQGLHRRLRRRRGVVPRPSAIPTCWPRCTPSSTSSTTRIPASSPRASPKKLADDLVAHAPAGIEHVYFVSGGSEAIEAALKLARQYFVERGEPQRKYIIARRQSYHGNTLGALAVGGNEWRRKQFAPLLIETHHVDAGLRVSRPPRRRDAGGLWRARWPQELEAKDRTSSAARR